MRAKGLAESDAAFLRESDATARHLPDAPSPAKIAYQYMKCACSRWRGMTALVLDLLGILSDQVPILRAGRKKVADRIECRTTVGVLVPLA